MAVSEHDFEPIRGLPGELPKGETLIWQGAPDWWALAIRAFHIRSVTIYFGVLMAWRGGAAVMGGADGIAALQAALGLAPVAVFAVLLLMGLAALTARTTVYTITSRRIVLRFGIALPKAVNLPFSIIEGATLRSNGGDNGDIAVTLIRPNKVAYFLLWPHVRPWKLSRPQPSLRAIPNASYVALQLGHALKAVHGETGVVHTPASPPEPKAHQGALSPA
jgi:Bacterial PH domain